MRSFLPPHARNTRQQHVAFSGLWPLFVSILLWSACGTEPTSSASADKDTTSTPSDSEGTEVDNSEITAPDSSSPEVSPPDSRSTETAEPPPEGLPPAENMFLQDLLLNGSGETPNMDDLYWDPASFPEYYPTTGQGDFVRFFAPACEDGTTPESRTCPDGQEPIRCTDGTRPVFYYRGGTNHRWLVRVQKGGSSCEVNYGSSESSKLSHNCWDFYFHRNEKRHFTSTKLDAKRSFQGIFRPKSGNAADSPFADYNVLYLDKCTGDRNLGDATVSDYVYRQEAGTPLPKPEYTGNMYFHGYRILSAILRAAHAQQGENQRFDQVMVFTQSNGTNGLYMYLDRLAALIRTLHPEAEVRGVGNSMMRSGLEVESTVNSLGEPDYAKIYQAGSLSALQGHLVTHDNSPANGMWASSQVYQSQGLEYERNRHWGAIDDTPTIDASCLAAHPDDAWVCLDHMHVLLHHISTPFFVIAQTRDPSLRDGTQHRFTTRWTEDNCDEGDVCCHDENYDLSVATCESYPASSFYPANPAAYTAEAFEKRIFHTMKALRTGFTTQSEMRPGCTGAPCDSSPLPSVPHGAFIDDISSHGSLETDDKALGVMNGRTLESLLADWVELGTDTFCVDISQENVGSSGTSAPWAPCPASP